MKKKIYTGTGDGGETSLFNGRRVPKDHSRVEAYGTVDELNSVLGLLVSLLSKDRPELNREIREIQNQLLRAGSWLATSIDSSAVDRLVETDPQFGRKLEDAIDRMEKELPALRGFIIPGGDLASSMAHVARTVCRRAERRVLTLLRSLETTPVENRSKAQLRFILLILNRLSDYLFVVARLCNKTSGTGDIRWKP